MSCEKLANFEQLTNNNFIVNVQWKNEDLLEKKKESWVSWVYHSLNLYDRDIKYVTFNHGGQPMIGFYDTLQAWAPFVKYYYGSDVPKRNTYVRPP